MPDQTPDLPVDALSALFAESPACFALYEAQPPFRVVAHNEALKRVLDPPFNETGVVGLSLPEFTTNAEQVTPFFARVAETGEPFSVERFRFDGLGRGTTWWNWSLSPVRQNGQVTRLMATAVEVTEVVRAHEALEAEKRARERTEALLAGEQEMFERIVAAVPVMITMYDSARKVHFVNRAFEEATGWTLDNTPDGRLFERCFPDPERLAEAERIIGERKGWQDFTLRTRDGRELETTWSNVQLSDDRQIGIGIDITQRRADERALRSKDHDLALERAFLEAVIETAPIGISVARDPQGKPPIVNREARRMMEIDGLPDSADRYDTLPIYELDGSRVAAEELSVARALYRGEEVAGRELIYGTSRGNRRWVVNARPLRDARGEVVAAITSFRDIEDQRAAEEAREQLVQELNHRVKNTLAIVSSIASQSFRNMADPDAAKASFNSRIRALAAAHDLLTRGNWKQAMLSDVLRSAVDACIEATRWSSQVKMRLRTDEMLAPKPAVSLSMALHEMTTNALKYGALRDAGGQISIGCETDPEAPDSLRFTWAERNAQPLAESAPRGIGMQLVETIFTREFGGSAEFDITGEGLQFSARMPRAAIGVH